MEIVALKLYGYEILERLIKPKFSEAGLDGDFQKARHADELFIFILFNQRTSFSV